MDYIDTQLPSSPLLDEDSRMEENSKYKEDIMEISENEMKICSHLSILGEFEFLRKRFSLLDFNNLICSSCSEKQQLWACLHMNCKFIGCGRTTSQKHALNHFLNYNQYEASIKNDDFVHCIAINLKNGMIWCYVCDMEITETDKEDLDKLISKIREWILSPNLPEEKTKESITTTSIMNKSVNTSKGICGLSNLGNTCYMNAALQSLSHCMPLTAFFRKCNPSSRIPKKINVSRAYSQLVQGLWSGKYSSISPTQLVKEMGDLNPLFRGFGQQDSQEFLRCLLDRLHEELKIGTKLPTSSTKKSTSSSIISETFEGTLLSKVKCLECNKESLTRDKFYDISVSIPDKKILDRASSTDQNLKKYECANNVGYFSGWLSTITYYLGFSKRTLSLEECLWSFFLTEDLNGNDKYACEHCKKLNDGQKSFLFDSLPEILCIHLKRFRYDSYFSSKISDHVIFPLKNLDVKPFITPSLQETGENTVYDLVSVINHRGGLSGGHYVTYALNQYTKTWYEFNDRYVSPVTPEEVSNVEAYVLFYQRKIPETKTQEIEKILSIKSQYKSTNLPLYYIPTSWYCKWKYSSCHPGPIDNSDFLCPHCLLKQNYPNIKHQLKEISKPVWEAFYSIYGGTSLTSIEICEACELERKKNQEKRNLESKEVLNLDSTEKPEGEPWFIVNENWLQAWRLYIAGIEQTLEPISNHELLDEDGLPKEGLRKVEHYRGVNRLVWEYFVKLYGGGPEIKRKTINIYDTDKW